MSGEESFEPLGRLACPAAPTTATDSQPDRSKRRLEGVQSPGQIEAFRRMTPEEPWRITAQLLDLKEGVDPRTLTPAQWKKHYAAEVDERRSHVLAKVLGQIAG